MNKRGLVSRSCLWTNQELKLNQKLSTRSMGYHSANYVVPTGYIVSTLDNLAMAATMDQSHVDQLM